MLQTSSQGRYPFVYPQCPAIAFSGSLTGYWATCLVGYISEDIIPSFPGTQPLCSWSVPVIRWFRVLFSSLILTGGLNGTKPAYLFEGSGRDRSVVAVLSFCLASVLLPCSLCQLSVVTVLLISFPRLTGIKPACLIGGFWSRATICSTSFFLYES